MNLLAIAPEAGSTEGFNMMVGYRQRNLSCGRRRQGDTSHLHKTFHVDFGIQSCKQVRSISYFHKRWRLNRVVFWRIFFASGRSFCPPKFDHVCHLIQILLGPISKACRRCFCPPKFTKSIISFRSWLSPFLNFERRTPLPVDQFYTPPPPPSTKFDWLNMQYVQDQRSLTDWICSMCKIVWRQNDAFCRNNDVIVASCVRWNI